MFEGFNVTAEGSMDQVGSILVEGKSQESYYIIFVFKMLSLLGPLSLHRATHRRTKGNFKFDISETFKCLKLIVGEVRGENATLKSF